MSKLHPSVIQNFKLGKIDATIILKARNLHSNIISEDDLYWYLIGMGVVHMVKIHLDYNGFVLVARVKTITSFMRCLKAMLVIRKKEFPTASIETSFN